LMSFESFHYARLTVEEQDASMYSSEWIQSSCTIGLDDVKKDAYLAGNHERSSMTVVQLCGCPPLSAPCMNGTGASIMSVSDLTVLDADEIPSVLVVYTAPLTESSTPHSGSIVEKCLLLLQKLVVILKGASDGIVRQIFFLTHNAEGPCVHGTEGIYNSALEYSSLVGGTIWGMIRTASLEIDPAMLRMVCIDTDTDLSRIGSDGFNQVLQELCETDTSKALEPEISYRGNTRFVRRLCKSKRHLIGDVEVTLNKRGSLENLVVSPSIANIRHIPDGTVEIDVYAVGLNFKDVLNVLVPQEAAYLGFDAPPLPGSDFAGVVTGIPDSNDGYPFAIGDKVYGLGFDMLRSKSLVSIDSIAKLPLGLSFEAASALPMVFLTVLFALKEQAGLKEGDRILIHSAAGGVGSAALQYAQFVGAEIYATASPPKHEYLRSIGINNISTSRDEASFADEMGQLVEGRGFDVVLSAGNLIDKSLELLAEGGCFLELGKRNILSNEEMLERRPDVKYFSYTLNELLHDKPEDISHMLNSLSEHFESEDFTSLRFEVFDFQSDLVNGFKQLREGTNIGKVVIQIKSEPNIGTALITGGLGGLGLVTAELLLDIGAEHIVLVSRSGRAKSYAGQNLEERLTQLLQEGNGTRVSIECCDMSNEGEVISLLERVSKTHGSINTIVHGSGALHDAWLHNMTAEDVRSSFGPKAAGAWYLHQHTADSDDIRHFVMFSSIAAMFGNPGQSNYAASNSYLDSLVRLRHSKGLPAVSIQWPAIADVGMAASNESMKLSQKEQLNSIIVKKVLKQLFASNLDGYDTIVAPIPQVLLQKANFPPKLLPFISNVASDTRVKISASHARGRPIKASKVWSLEEIQMEVESAVRKVVTIDSSEHIDYGVSLMDNGLDSLGTTELSDALQSCFGIKLESMFILNYPTITDTSNYLLSLLAPDIDEDHIDAAEELISGSAKVIEFSTRRKPRILCLHGAGSNNMVTSYQIEGLKLTNRFDCVFIHAPHATACAAGLDEIITGPFYSWADLFKAEVDLEAQWHTSFDVIAKYCAENGPFDGVYGFSQGVAIVTNFSHPSIWKDRFQMEKCPWNFAILACGSYGSLMTIGTEIPISLPSFHILGREDIFYDQSKALLTYWDSFHKVISTHARGHEIDMFIWTREKHMMILLDNFLAKLLSSTPFQVDGHAITIGHSSADNMDIIKSDQYIELNDINQRGDLEKNLRMQLESLDEAFEHIQFERLKLQKALLDVK